jgi:magnesium chelatase family protein
VSGPLLDRFDLRVTVKPVDPQALSSDRPEPLPVSPEQMATARDRQAERARRFALPRARNARIPGRLTREATDPDRAANDLLTSAMRRLALSARAFHRTLRVSRTIADLSDARRVEERHVTEALQYRGDEGVTE